MGANDGLAEGGYLIVEREVKAPSNSPVAIFDDKQFQSDLNAGVRESLDVLRAVFGSDASAELQVQAARVVASLALAVNKQKAGQKDEKVKGKMTFVPGSEAQKKELEEAALAAMRGASRLGMKNVTETKPVRIVNDSE